MKPLFLATLIAASSMSLRSDAAEAVTVANASIWTGGRELSFSGPESFYLSRAGVLSRRFSGERLRVDLLSRPFFSPSPFGSPSLEVGPASLSFVRNESGAGVVLLGTDAIALGLPIHLGSDGRSEHAVTITFEFDRRAGLASVTILGTPTQFAAEPTELDVIDVVFSAGDTADWEIRQLMVSVNEPTVAGSGSDANHIANEEVITKSAQNGAIDTASRAVLRAELTHAARAGNRAGLIEALQRRLKRKAGSAAWHLEAAWLLRSVARELASVREEPPSRLAAELALEESTVARSMAGITPALKSISYRISGAIQRDFYGDVVAARASFQSAVVANPDDQTAQRNWRSISNLSLESANTGKR